MIMSSVSSSSKRSRDVVFSKSPRVCPGMNGNHYQVTVTFAACLQGLEHIEGTSQRSFKVKCEVKDAGAFDDIVLVLEDEKKATHHHYIQVKHHEHPYTSAHITHDTKGVPTLSYYPGWKSITSKKENGDEVHFYIMSSADLSSEERSSALTDSFVHVGGHLSFMQGLRVLHEESTLFTTMLQGVVHNDIKSMVKQMGKRASDSLDRSGLTLELWNQKNMEGYIKKIEAEAKKKKSDKSLKRIAEDILSGDWKENLKEDVESFKEFIKSGYRLSLNNKRVDEYEAELFGWFKKRYNKPYNLREIHNLFCLLLLKIGRWVREKVEDARCITGEILNDWITEMREKDVLVELQVAEYFARKDFEIFKSQLDNFLNGDDKVLCIHGAAGSGKTTAVVHALFELKKNEKCVAIHGSSDLVPDEVNKDERYALVFHCRTPKCRTPKCRTPKCRTPKWWIGQFKDKEYNGKVILITNEPVKDPEIKLLSSPVIDVKAVLQAKIEDEPCLNLSHEKRLDISHMDEEACSELNKVLSESPLFVEYIVNLPKTKIVGGGKKHRKPPTMKNAEKYIPLSCIVYKKRIKIPDDLSCWKFGVWVVKDKEEAEKVAKHLKTELSKLKTLKEVKNDVGTGNLLVMWSSNSVEIKKILGTLSKKYKKVIICTNSDPGWARLLLSGLPHEGYLNMEKAVPLRRETDLTTPLKSPGQHLIAAGPGAGKSFSMMEFYNQWKHSTGPVGCCLWVMLIPLRDLGLRFSEASDKPKDEDDIASFLVDTYLKPESMWRWLAVSDTKAGRTKFLLDGWDEMPAKYRSECNSVLKFMFNRKNVVLSSRTSDISAETQTEFTNKLLLQPFNKEQIKNYFDGNSNLAEMVNGKLIGVPLHCKMLKKTIDWYGVDVSVLNRFSDITFLLRHFVAAQCMNADMIADAVENSTDTLFTQIGNAVRRSEQKVENGGLVAYLERRMYWELFFLQRESLRYIESSLPEDLEGMEGFEFLKHMNNQLDRMYPHMKPALDRIEFVQLGRDRELKYDHLSYVEYLIAQYLVQSGTKVTSHVFSIYKFESRLWNIWRYVDSLMKKEEEEGKNNRDGSESDSFLVKEVKNDPIDCIGGGQERLLKYLKNEQEESYETPCHNRDDRDIPSDDEDITDEEALQTDIPNNSSLFELAYRLGSVEEKNVEAAFTKLSNFPHGESQSSDGSIYRVSVAVCRAFVNLHERLARLGNVERSADCFLKVRNWLNTCMSETSDSDCQQLHDDKVAAAICWIKLGYDHTDGNIVYNSLQQALYNSTNRILWSELPTDICNNIITALKENSTNVTGEQLKRAYQNLLAWDDGMEQLGSTFVKLYTENTQLSTIWIEKNENTFKHIQNGLLDYFTDGNIRDRFINDLVLACAELTLHIDSIVCTMEELAKRKHLNEDRVSSFFNNLKRGTYFATESDPFPQEKNVFEGVGRHVVNMMIEEGIELTDAGIGYLYENRELLADCFWCLHLTGLDPNVLATLLSLYLVKGVDLFGRDIYDKCVWSNLPISEFVSAVKLLMDPTFELPAALRDVNITNERVACAIGIYAYDNQLAVTVAEKKEEVGLCVVSLHGPNSKYEIPFEFDSVDDLKEALRSDNKFKEELEKMYPSTSTVVCGSGFEVERDK